MLFAFISYFLLSSSTFISAYGHFSHAAHYNNGQTPVGDKYSVFQQMEPEYTKPNETSNIQFSIQDNQGKDVGNKVVMVEIYSTLTNERLTAFPWTNVEIGDFQIPYIFPKIGNYQIVLSLLNDNVDATEILNTISPARNILGDNLNCNCERAVFNISVGESFGFIFISVIYGSILGVILIVGSVLSWMFLSRRKSKTNPISNEEFIKYSVLFLAVGAAIVHLAVYSGHATLRLEYSIFLLSAAGGQLFYGISYIFLIFSDDRLEIKKSDKRFISKEYYKKSKILNWIGLGGSLVLIGLYIYSVTFPPPLSPNAHPEDVDLAGVIDKSLEIVLVIGIIYLMKTEKKRYLYSRQISDSKNM
ncbi:MAG TPA: hypothetical protein VD815_06985 [Candidatus Saccharimonadales bacterium]|nr:hypothetical protein [Candidatus Saccharimonadales bacterium]